MAGGNPNPVDGTKNLVHRGRFKGAQCKHKRVLRHALVLAAEASKHSKTSDLFGYCLYLADEEPALFVSLLGRIIPLQAKVDTRAEFNIHEFNLNTPLSEMMSIFAERINSAYVPNTIEHEDNPEDEEEQ